MICDLRFLGHRRLGQMDHGGPGRENDFVVGYVRSVAGRPGVSYCVSHCIPESRFSRKFSNGNLCFLSQFQRYQPIRGCFLAKSPFHLALTGPTVQPSDGLKPLSFPLSSASWKADYFFVWIFPRWDLEKLQHNRVNILDLKILQLFFKNRGEVLGF